MTLPNIQDPRRVRLGAALRAPRPAALPAPLSMSLSGQPRAALPASRPAVSDAGQVRLGAALRAALPVVADARRVRLGAALKHR